MSEEIIPDVALASDVVVAEPVETAEPAVNYSEKTLAELVKLFEELVQNEERMKMSKEAEASSPLSTRDSRRRRPRLVLPLQSRLQRLRRQRLSRLL